MQKLSRGELEAAFTRAIIKLEKEYLGRGPMDARTYVLDDIVLVRLRGVLTLAEVKLSETESGRDLVKETRRRLFESTRSMIEDAVREIFGRTVISLHTDLSTRTGERVIVLTLDQAVE